MLDRCPLIFEGRVTQKETRRPPNGGQIHTYVTFEILDIIKGNYDGDTIVLSFLGGTLPNGKGLRVSGMVIPEIGEEGIYFVNSLARTQVHPFYGWAQGHLLVKPDPAGVRRVTTLGGKPVISINPGPADKKKKLSTGVAQGLNVERSGATAQGMEVSLFKQKLRELGRQ